MSDLDGDEAGPDFAERELCPDGSCTGLVGADGRCKLCGAGGAAAGTAITAPDLDAAAAPLAAATESSDEDLFADRRLCPDGACIGVLGDDDRCKVCGSAPLFDGHVPS